MLGKASDYLKLMKTNKIKNLHLIAREITKIYIYG